jgi:chromosome segregation ATPase
MSTSAVLTEQERPASAVETKIRALDSRLDDLRARRNKAETDLATLGKRESKLIRNYADADNKEKHEMRGEVDRIAADRVNLERELRSLQIVQAEAEQERAALVPAFEAAWEERNREERKRKLAELEAVHNTNQQAIHDLEEKLFRAKETAQKSFFDLTTFRAIQAEQERQRTLEAAKISWQRFSGPAIEARKNVGG